MTLEKTGTSYKCNKCKHIWDHQDTHYTGRGFNQ
jgi:DNA-directed RNA polymerase subunit RPC12/RpoP